MFVLEVRPPDRQSWLRCGSSPAAVLSAKGRDKSFISTLIDNRKSTTRRWATLRVFSQSHSCHGLLTSDEGGRLEAPPKVKCAVALKAVQDA